VVCSVSWDFSPIVFYLPHQYCIPRLYDSSRLYFNQHYNARRRVSIVKIIILQFSPYLYTLEFAPHLKLSTCYGLPWSFWLFLISREIPLLCNSKIHHWNYKTRTYISPRQPFDCTFSRSIYRSNFHAINTHVLMYHVAEDNLSQKLRIDFYEDRPCSKSVWSYKWTHVTVTKSIRW
jgi:hypothetical protein